MASLNWNKHKNKDKRHLGSRERNRQRETKKAGWESVNSIRNSKPPRPGGYAYFAAKCGEKMSRVDKETGYTKTQIIIMCDGYRRRQRDRLVKSERVEVFNIEHEAKLHGFEPNKVTPTQSVKSHIKRSVKEKADRAISKCVPGTFHYYQTLCNGMYTNAEIIEITGYTKTQLSNMCRSFSRWQRNIKEPGEMWDKFDLEVVRKERLS